MEFIPVGTTAEIRIPVMMPNTDFTKKFTEATETAESITQITLVGNAFVNILLSGAMTFLWGMINCIQIVSHFDLVNISMPANASFLYQILVSIATFNILPTESLIAEIEAVFGIVNDDFTLTESFINFQFDSSGPIRNLQIMFLAMAVLLTLPVILLIIKALFCWNSKVVNCVSRMLKSLFFNVYIRFGLEAYLELSLSSMIRFMNYTFDSPSEKFHTVFATLIFVAIVAYLLFALVFLQLRYTQLDQPRAKSMYGDLYLGLKTRERTAILSPFFFMLRRLLFAGILVNWSERSYF